MAERLLPKRSTEKTSAVLPRAAAPASQPENSAPAPSGHGRHRAAAFRGANRVAIALATLDSGDLCPECRRGKVYRQKEPATLVRFVGHAPLEATVFEMERLRCNACGQVFTADAPATAGPDKYDATAVAMIALMKYGTGVLFHRLERLEQQLGMPLSAATQWEIREAATQWIRPALEELIRQAAQGGVLHNDDTGMRILRLVREPGDKRTGTFTRGIVSMVGVWRIALYFTGWKHAREHDRCVETARPRASRTHSDVRRIVAQHAEAGRDRDPAGELPRPLSGLRRYPERMDGKCVGRDESLASVVIISACQIRPSCHEGLGEAD